MALKGAYQQLEAVKRAQAALAAGCLLGTTGGRGVSVHERACPCMSVHVCACLCMFVSLCVSVCCWLTYAAIVHAGWTQPGLPEEPANQADCPAGQKTGELPDSAPIEGPQIAEESSLADVDAEATRRRQQQEERGYSSYDSDDPGMTWEEHLAQR